MMDLYRILEAGRTCMLMKLRAKSAVEARDAAAAYLKVPASMLTAELY